MSPESTIQTARANRTERAKKRERASSAESTIEQERARATEECHKLGASQIIGEYYSPGASQPT